MSSEPVGLEIGASGLVHGKLCTVLLLELGGIPHSLELLCKGLVLPIDHKMPAQLLGETMRASMSLTTARASSCWVCSSAMRWFRASSLSSFFSCRRHKVCDQLLRLNFFAQRS